MKKLYGVPLVLAVHILGAQGLAHAQTEGACFELDNPEWDDMRAAADEQVAAGELTPEQAEAYKCDPRLIFKDLETQLSDPSQIKVTITQLAPFDKESFAEHADALGWEADEDEEATEGPASVAAMDSAAAAKKPKPKPKPKKPKKKCVEGYLLTKEMGKPALLKAQQSINWCFDGKKVSDWSGSCTGEVTKWGKAIYWSFDSCSQNDWIPYKLNGKVNGGIHHKTKHNFTNKVPWTYDWSTTLEQWGHYDGTIDQMVDGKLLHR